MWRGIKACQKWLLYKSCYVISAGSRWAELCSLSLTSKGSLSWANILSHFHWANLTLAAPRRRTWQWQMRQCVEDWGGGGRRGEGAGGGSPREGWLPPRGETLTHWPRLVASQRKQPLAQGAASESTHFYTWTNSETGQEKRPTHLCVSPRLPFSFPPSKNTLSGAPSDAFWPPLLSPFFLSSDGYVHIFLVPFASPLKHYLLLWMRNLTIIYLVLFSQLFILMNNVCINKKKRKERKGKKDK